MRCKKHFTDLSSSVGVCASCLRERLFALIAAQAQEYRRKSEPQPPPVVFPRSVSPNICRLKSENTAWKGLLNQRFYSTPQVGPNGACAHGAEYRKKQSRFSLFARLFRPKSEKAEMDLRVSISNSRDSFAASSSSSSLFSTLLPGRRKKQSPLFSLDESTDVCDRTTGRHRDRGMSPARVSVAGDDEDYCDGLSQKSLDSLKQTPARATPQGRRGGGRPCHSRNVSGFKFCLSPLVRASPSQGWNQKGMPPDMAFSGEIRIPAKPHLSTAASYCANRSRKVADFGRFNHNR